MSITKQELEAGAQTERFRAVNMRKRAVELRASADDLEEWAKAAEARAADYVAVASAMP